MEGQEITMEVGSVQVTTTEGRGLSVEYWAERCVGKIVHISEDATDEIKEQAQDYRDQIKAVIMLSMKSANESYKTTLYNLLLKQGETEMAETLRRL